MPHIHDKIDFTIEVFIVHNNKVLLRIHDKLKKWLSVGGHIELDEDPVQAAIREVKEEVGLDIKIPEPNFNSSIKDYKELMTPRFLNRHKINENHEHVTLVYFVKSNTDKLILSKTEITEDCKWFTKEEINNDSSILPHIKYYAIKALEETN
ncbi:MAG: NUDIX domain-containing protein [Candidatus Pacearchaeota archaeon]|jgi:8-oxo-dGTP pyrophosphatase MutT (NUDIX family)